MAVIQADCSEARNKARPVKSSGMPILFKGTVFPVCSMISFFVCSREDPLLCSRASFSHDLLHTGPGEMELTRILSGARVWARETVKLESPAFMALYCGKTSCGLAAAMDDFQV